jgi:hypothetical protein
MPEPFCVSNDEHSHTSVVSILSGVGGDIPLTGTIIVTEPCRIYGSTPILSQFFSMLRNCVLAIPKHSLLCIFLEIAWNLFFCAFDAHVHGPAKDRHRSGQPPKTSTPNHREVLSKRTSSGWSSTCHSQYFLSDSYHIFTAYRSLNSSGYRNVVAEELSGISTMRGLVSGSLASGHVSLRPPLDLNDDRVLKMSTEETGRLCIDPGSLRLDVSMCEDLRARVGSMDDSSPIPWLPEARSTTSGLHHSCLRHAFHEPLKQAW